MLFRRWDPGSQGLKRNRSDLYHYDKIGRIWRRKGISATRAVSVLQRILWVGENIGIEGSVSSLRSSKWMWNLEDQSQDYQGMIFVTIKTRSYPIDKEMRENKACFACYDWQKGILYMFYNTVLDRFIGLKECWSVILRINYRIDGMFGSCFIFYLSLVVFSMWVGGPHKFMDWNKNGIVGYCFLLLVLINHYGDRFILSDTVFCWCLVICWRLSAKIGNRLFDWSSLSRWIEFSGLLIAMKTVDLVSSNQLQRRDTDMEKSRRPFSKGMQADDRVVTRQEVELYLVFSTILLLGVKSILAMLVVSLDRGNSFRDGKKVFTITGSEIWPVKGIKCNDFGYKWNDLNTFIAPLFVYWSNIEGADHGLEFLRCVVVHCSAAIFICSNFFNGGVSYGFVGQNDKIWDPFSFPEDRTAMAL